MDIENLIKHYLIVYSGKLDLALKNVKGYVMRTIPNNKIYEYSNMVDCCFMEMVKHKIIRIVPYEEMTPEQKVMFDRDNEPICEILG